MQETVAFLTEMKEQSDKTIILVSMSYLNPLVGNRGELVGEYQTKGSEQARLAAE